MGPETPQYEIRSTNEAQTRRDDYSPNWQTGASQKWGKDQIAKTLAQSTRRLAITQTTMQARKRWRFTCFSRWLGRTFNASAQIFSGIKVHAILYKIVSVIGVLLYKPAFGLLNCRFDLIKFFSHLFDILVYFLHAFA